jgi:hypothetical protein
MKKVVLRNLVGKQTCNNILQTFNGQFGGIQEELPIKDRNNFSNTLYTSTRSPGYSISI